MARLPRLIVPGQVHHVLQRSNGGQAAFVDAHDHQAMLDLLAQYTQDFGVAVHAYVLMPTYWHLLATPDTAEGLPAMVQAVGRRYVRQFNQRHGRRGGLWEGRFRSTVVEAGQHLLPGMVWIDTAPLRRLAKRLANGVPLVEEDVTTARAVIDATWQAYIRLPVEITRSHAQTEEIAIAFDRMGIREAA